MESAQSYQLSISSSRTVNCLRQGLRTRRWGNLKNVNSRLSIIDCELESIFKSPLSKQCLNRIHESRDEKPD